MKRVRKFTSLFRIRFNAGIQYRAAALAGIATQFAWGFLNIMLYMVFYRSNPNAFPMTLQALVSYMWLRQAFLMLFETYGTENAILESITSGGVAYELARPTGIYGIWYVRTLSARVSKMLLRFWPVILVAALLPAPYGLSLPANPAAFVGFLCTLVLGTLIATAYIMLIYIVTLFTMQPWGVRIAFNSLAELLTGSLIPLPFFPAAAVRILELTPFAAMSNVPYRIYSGDIAGAAAWQAAGLQVFWLLALFAFGQFLLSHALRRTVIQGG